MQYKTKYPGKENCTEKRRQAHPQGAQDLNNFIRKPIFKNNRNNTENYTCQQRNQNSRKSQQKSIGQCLGNDISYFFSVSLKRFTKIGPFQCYCRFPN